jgi:carbon monoxide dehydrogenase subunit G
VEFQHSFTVTAPMDRVMLQLSDVPEVAPCVPGAQITDQVDDRHYKGLVKVKLGAVQMTFRGDLELTVDQPAHKITLSGKGQETRGGSGASGTVLAELSENGDGSTLVSLNSRVDVSGRLAQFGRSIIPDVAGRLIKEFAACLELKLTGPNEGHVEQPESVLDMGSVTVDVLKSRAGALGRKLTGRDPKP